MKLVYCPTEDMLGDYSSKPLQGGLFVKQINMLQGVKEEDFRIHKEWHRRALEKYELWDADEADLKEA